MVKRVITAVVAGSAALVCILLSSPIPIAALLLIALILGLFELTFITNRNIFAVCFAALIGLGIAWWQPIYGVIAIFLIGVISLLHNKLTSLTPLWLVAGFAAAFLLHKHQIGDEATFAANALLLAWLPLWVGDSLAYFVGKKWGSRKLAPKLSPKKTVEGGVANFIGCIAAATALAAYMGVQLPLGVYIGISCGILGQVGDLLQSKLKRGADIKDSGSLLPGHGGILDRLDSLLLSAPASLMLVYVIPHSVFHEKHTPFPW